MARLHLIRHGQAAAGWDADPDPGLDDLGHAQAAGAAATMAPLGPMPLVCSPLRRTRETAAPLAEAWGLAPVVEPLRRRDPEPDGRPRRAGSVAAHGAGGVLVRPGSRAPRLARTTSWPPSAELEQETTVVTHFVAINAVLGAALGEDRLVVRSVANASTTVVDHQGDRIVLVREPSEAPTTVL